MNSLDRQGSKAALAIGVWSLWIDAVGGFRILEGHQFTLGGPGGEPLADIAVRCAWSRQVASLQRVGGDFWIRQAGEMAKAAPVSHETPFVRLPADPKERAVSQGEPCLRLFAPSPLSGTVTLTLDLPYRFVSPADMFLLFDQTILIGPEPTSHIRLPGTCGSYVLMKSGNGWLLRSPTQPPQTLAAGTAARIGDIGLTIRDETAKDRGELS